MRARTVAVSIALVVAVSAVAADRPDVGAPRQQAQISGDPTKPRRHFRVPNAAELSPADAKRIYARIATDVEEAYKLSRHPVATSYRRWKQYNAAPYRSATHGRRYVNNYANRAAAAYGRYEDAGTLPVGAVIAKDSFAVTEDGAVHPGPMFVMEKMPAGFNDASGDWRYTMIMPDGSIFGVTDGTGSKRVEYCISCHLARESHDHLFFVPEAYRLVAGD